MWVLRRGGGEVMLTRWVEDEAFPAVGGEQAWTWQMRRVLIFGWPKLFKYTGVLQNIRVGARTLESAWKWGWQHCLAHRGAW